jgi:hypothetical protein
LVVLASLTIARVLAKVVEVAVGGHGQALKLFLPVLPKFTLENVPRGRATQALMGFIDLGEQLDIGASVALRKAMPLSDFLLHSPHGRIAPHQASQLSATEAGHFADVTPQEASRSASLPHVFLLAQQPFGPTIKLFAFPGLKAHLVRGPEKLLNLLQA